METLTTVKPGDKYHPRAETVVRGTTDGIHPPYDPNNRYPNASPMLQSLEDGEVAARKWDPTEIDFLGLYEAGQNLDEQQRLKLFGRTGVGGFRMPEAMMVFDTTPGHTDRLHEIDRLISQRHGQFEMPVLPQLHGDEPVLLEIDSLLQSTPLSMEPMTMPLGGVSFPIGTKVSWEMELDFEQTEWVKQLIEAFHPAETFRWEEPVVDEDPEATPMAHRVHRAVDLHGGTPQAVLNRYRAAWFERTGKMLGKNAGKVLGRGDRIVLDDGSAQASRDNLIHMALTLKDSDTAEIHLVTLQKAAEEKAKQERKRGMVVLNTGHTGSLGSLLMTLAIAGDIPMARSSDRIVLDASYARDNILEMVKHLEVCRPSHFDEKPWIAMNQPHQKRKKRARAGRKQEREHSLSSSSKRPKH